jgi:hypothetical protein
MQCLVIPIVATIIENPGERAFRFSAMWFDLEPLALRSTTSTPILCVFFKPATQSLSYCAA